MDDIRKNIRRVFWLYFTLFAVLTVYLVKFLLIDSKGIITSQYNPRLKQQKLDVTRGDILDLSGNKLAYTDDSGKRIYPLGYAAAHAIGYYNAGSAGFYGAEAKYSFELQNVSSEIVQQVNHVISSSKIMGDSIVLTLDARLQTYIYNQLQGYKAGAIILEPATGKLLAMVSTPSFDPNTLSDNYSILTDDTEGSPLLNRAAQGKYPPGSVFKIVTAAAALELPSCADFSYICTGEDFIGEKSIKCYNSTPHGNLKLSGAFAHSCNTFFSNIGILMGADFLRTMSNRLYFNSILPFPLECGVSSFPLNKFSGSSEIVDTSIGQGKIMTSPLQIALITAAVANNGVIMTPYIVDHIETYNGKTARKNMPIMAKHVFSSEISASLTKMMIDVTEYGTGSQAAVSNIKIAAKTGSAQTPNGMDHGWYTAFFPADNPQFVLCIVMENIGGSSKVLPIGKNIIEHLTNLGK